MPGWLVDRITDIIFWIGIPALLIVSVIAPFFVLKKILKRRLTIPNIIICLIIAIALVALDLYALYWGILILGSIAVNQLYGG